MTAAAFADRLALYQRCSTHPSATYREHATALGRSISWVKKWSRRFGAPPSPDPAVCQARSCAPHAPPPRLSDAVVERILALRESLVERFHRTVGPKTILYFLQQETDLAAERLPRSPTTIWRVLRQHQRIGTPASPPRQLRQLPAPLTEVELDFTDIPTIVPDDDPSGKRQHAGEVLNWVDAGTSIPLVSLASADFTMETSIRACAAIVAQHGVPPHIRCDRDPRFVGGQQMDGVPSAWERFWHALGVTLEICPPQRPDLKPYGERYHRTLKEECLLPAWPTTIAEAQMALDTWREWFMHERPHQGQACQNQPPAVAFPALPSWPSVPALVDPDRWVATLHGTTIVRQVNANGSIKVGGHTYSLGQALRGQAVTVQIAAPTRELIIYHAERAYRRHPLKGLIGELLPFEVFVERLCAAARRETARVRARQRTRTRGR